MALRPHLLLPEHHAEGGAELADNFVRSLTGFGTPALSRWGEIRPALGSGATISSIESGAAWTTNGTSTGAVDLGVMIPTDGYGGTTLFIEFVAPSLASDVALFCTSSNAAYAGHRIIITTAGAFSLLMGDGGGTGTADRRSLTSGSGVVVAGRLARAAIAVDSSTTGRLWINGATHTLSASGTGGAYVNGSGNAHIGLWSTSYSTVRVSAFAAWRLPRATEFLRQITVDPPSVIYASRRIWVPVTAAGGAPTGLATETDAALALAAVQIRPAGLASEVDSALGLAAVSIRPTGLATEADAALALPAVQLGSVGLAAETDSALALAAVQLAPAGMAVETDAALALEPSVPGAVGLAVETDVALALAGVQIRAVGVATETDAALALPVVQVGGVGLVLEIDAAFALAPLQLGAVGRADETDAALALTSPGGTASAAEVWEYELSNGQTAGAVLVQILAYLEELHLIHGLRAGSPLEVTDSSRSAGAVLQSLAEAAGTVTVTRQ